MPPIRPETEQAAVARFKHLTEIVLPARASAEHWPLRFDHCFKRVCLDHAFGDVWYHHLRRPAEKHLAGEYLRRALACAEELAAGSTALLRERDAASLRLRGKPPKRPCASDALLRTRAIPQK